MIFSSEAGEKPQTEALTFLNKVSRNDQAGALKEFGDNTCHCAPKGGYEAYLHGYEVAQEPNITFLMGKPLVFGTQPRVKFLPENGTPYVFPWDKPEDAVVYMPVEFANPSDRPYFLPLDSAFGFQITENQLEKFKSDRQDWTKALTLRLRSSLQSDTVRPRDPKAPPTELEKAAKDGLLPAEMAKYIHPADAGTVKMATGEVVPMQQLKDSLPRLKSCEVGMKIVRRGSFRRWAKKLGVVNCVLVSGNKEFKIATNDADTESEQQQSLVKPKHEPPATPH
jgi:hypothetical protein